MNGCKKNQNTVEAMSYINLSQKCLLASGLGGTTEDGKMES